MEEEVKTNQENEMKEVEINVDYKERYLRALADYKNLKRVTEEQRSKLLQLSTMSIIKRFLPIIDDVEAGANTGDIAMNAIYRKCIVMLAEMGVYQFGREDKMFDPKYHNAIATEFDQNKEENEIIEVKRYGYKMNDDIIRIADVIVNKKPEETAEIQTEE